MLRGSWLITIVSPYLVARFALRNLEVKKTLLKQNQDQMEMRYRGRFLRTWCNSAPWGIVAPFADGATAGVGVGVAQAAWTRWQWRGIGGSWEQLPLPRLPLQARHCPTDPGQTHFVSDQGAWLLAPPLPR